MSSVASEPPVALARPVLPELNARGQIDIPAPPIRPEDERGWLAVILPALSALGMIGFLVLSPNVLVIALGGGFALLSAVGAVVAGRQRRRRCQRSWMAREGQFRTRLAQSAESFAEAALRQRTHALVVHPAPDAAASAAAEGAVWERQPGTAEHLHVRVGIGPGPARLSPRRSSGGDDSGAEPALSALAEGVLGRYGAVAGLPLALDVADARGLVLHGDHLPLLRAMIVSLTRAHGPRSVLLHVLAPPAELAWIRQLPHAGRTGSDPAAFAAAVRAHLRASSTDPAEPFHAIVLAATADSTLLAWRSLAPLVEQSPHSKRPPLSLIGLLPRDSSVPQEASAVAVGDGEGGLLVRRLGGGPTHATVARPDAISHPQACRYAKAIHQRLEADEAAVSDLSPLLLDSLAGGDRSALQIPIGVDDDGMVVLVDPREAARHGDGPHGLIVGATGSGKSELLRTLLTAAAQQNRAEELTFLLVDFKGGAALAELAGLPHTVGVLTNLTADVHGVTRLCAALRAELRRRQSILREAAVDNLDSYQQTGGEALPRLLVVVDEYAELIEQSPDVLDVLTSLARLGRSLGIHLLLCSQRLDDGRLRGLEAHLRFRICLRTFTAAESIAVVGSAVASALPPSPGWAYLSRDGNLTRFRVALVADPRAAVAAVARSGGGTPQRPVCLPPLPRLLTLDCLPEEQGSSPTTAAIGVLDVPGTAQHPPLLYDLAVDGHVAVVGAPRAGRSTALTTLVAALASRVPSRELAVHVVAPADGPLAGLAGLPHVGTVATSPELAARVIRTVADAVTERRASNTAPHGRVLLVIDDLGALLAADESVAPAINLIAATGQSVGVTLAASCGRWAELRGGVREAISTRYELACPDPSDSMLPQVARTYPGRPAGRVLTGDGTWAQIALPRSDGAEATVGLNVALAEVVARVARRGGPATQPIQLLPALVPARSLPRPSRDGSVVLGLSGPYARPVELGLQPGEHLLVLGNPGSGRSGLLRSIALSLQDGGRPTWFVDPRRSLVPVAGPACGHATSADETAALFERLAASREGWTAAGAGDVLFVDDLDLVGRSTAAGSLVQLLEVLPFAADHGLSLVVSRRLSGYARAAYEPFFAGFLELCDSAVVLSGDPAEGPVIGGVRPRRLAPGRGQLVVRGEARGEIQTAWLSGDAGHHADPTADRQFAQPGASARIGM